MRGLLRLFAPRRLCRRLGRRLCDSLCGRLSIRRNLRRLSFRRLDLDELTLHHRAQLGEIRAARADERLNLVLEATRFPAKELPREVTRGGR